jgi:putative ABC transport system permease protein
MKAYDLIELAGRNLRQSVLRNSLTTIGISVGVASLVSMLSLGIGLQQLATKRLERSGLFGTVIVTPGRPGRGLMRRQAQAKDADAEIRPLDEAARQEIARLPYVAETFADVRFPMELSYGDVKPRRITAAGVPASSRTTEAFEDLKGRFFSSENAAEVILPKGVAGELTGRVVRRRDAAELDAGDLAKELVGKSVTMTYAEHAAGGVDVGGYSVVPHTQALKIVGILDLNPEGMRGPGAARAFLPLKFADALHAFQPSDIRDSMHTEEGPPTYLSLNVRLKDPSHMQAVEDAIKKKGFSTFSILDATRSIQQIFAVFDVFLGVFGSLALAVASLGIVNTLVMAILERRREIGIMKAIGASDQDVRRIFFAEAGTMGVAGGAVGVTLGWAIGQVINFGTNLYLARQNLPAAEIWFVPWWLVGGAIGFALAISLISGWYPAARAAHLDPVQALRYE